MCVRCVWNKWSVVESGVKFVWKSEACVRVCRELGG